MREELQQAIKTSYTSSKDQGKVAIESVEELTRRNIETIARLEQTAQAERTPADRVADTITSFCGSMMFVYVHIAWYGFWILWNTLPFIPKHLRFDPKPFEFLTLIVSLEAIFLSTFILISQNQQARLAERRNHLDLQINLLSEQENSKMLMMLASLCRNAGLDDDPEVHIFEEETQPEKMLQQIKEVIEKAPAPNTAVSLNKNGNTRHG